MIIRSMLVLTLLLPLTAANLAFASPAFRQVWERTDYPVQQGRGEHAWIWGPAPFTAGINEAFQNGARSSRLVQYFDKGRMEINDPAGDPRNPWFVTSGLLVRDMIDGRVQIGNADYVALPPAAIPVAGDPDATFPTYADLRAYARAQPRPGLGDAVAERLTPRGRVPAPEFADLAATRIAQVANGYGIPRAFWEFLTRSGTIYRDGRFVRATPLFDWLYIAGYPIADAFWVRVPVAGVPRDVMVQPFERRVLTYNPANPPLFQVEMGNVGRHYYRWVYELPFASGQQALITTPARDSVVGSPLVVQGFERGDAFEAAIRVRLRAADGQVLASVYTMVQRPDIGVPGPFSTTLVFSEPQTATPGTVEVVVESAADGSEGIIASQPVLIGGLAGDLARSVALAREDLAARTEIWPESIGIRSTEDLIWPDSSLGCPVPDQGYLQVLTPGFRIVLEAAGQPYDYRANRRGTLILCQDRRPRALIGAPLSLPARGAATTLPLHVEARLEQTGEPLILRLVFESGQRLSQMVTPLTAPDGAGLVLNSLWPPAGSVRLNTQRAIVQIRDRQDRLLAARMVTILGPDDPLTRPVELYWLAGERLQVEQRRIPRTLSIGAATLEQLLWGPPPGLGFSTAIPTPAEVLSYPGRQPGWGARVRLHSLVIRDGVATADFSAELRAYGGGAARVTAIRQQIERTLRQFPAVREVRIAIEGQTEGVLEP
ncbi:MAG: GerMN domain-containing protein [Chloroflexaceae bacterium]